ncbi:DUF6320 domain-containing protein [Microbacterium sp. gxy059]|uniref:DUF6320 domain-containing protein n=1 Tax=Microbacterium sp. gxy059 TaxID=2957199 RepID=UPI003D96C3C3
MRRCPDCAVGIEGSWSRCPLCGSAAAGDPSPDPLPAVPLSFSRRRVLRILFLVSLAVIAASFLAQLLLQPSETALVALRSVWLGVTALWLVVLMAVRKRRNAAKGNLYLVVLVGLVCVYGDYLTGWHGWALDYAVPIACATSIIATLIVVRVLRIDVGDHIVYSLLTALLAVVPLLFALLGWVTDPLPSVLCAALGLVALGVQLARIRDVRHELAKRLHL